MVERPTQFQKRLEDHGANWTELPDDGPRVVSDFGDFEDEYRAIRTPGKAGLVDLSERDTLVVRGPDAVEWLQGLVTNDVFDLAEPGSGQRTCVLNANGRVIAIAQLLHAIDLLMFDLEAGVAESRAIPHLRSQRITEDVELDDRSDQSYKLGLFGPEALDAIDEVLIPAPDATPIGEVDSYCGTWGFIGDAEVVVQRAPCTGSFGVRISCDEAHLLSLWNTLEQGTSFEILPTGRQALEVARIEAGMPRHTVEVTDKNIPLEADLESTISFDKGCYLGQEIVVRIRDLGEPARRLRTIVFEGGAAPEVGAKIRADDRSVGEVKSSVWSPAIDRPIALGYVKRGFDAPESKVEVEGREAVVRELGHPLNQE